MVQAIKPLKKEQRELLWRCQIAFGKPSALNHLKLEGWLEGMGLPFRVWIWRRVRSCLFGILIVQTLLQGSMVWGILLYCTDTAIKYGNHSVEGPVAGP